ncbi:DUF4230 domain-containing protein [Rossellomorea marisflavi]|uniref:DUF4230 domain-containing protein n=1 Tax=Rossellomorea marisflavi TaxID=189381 RepID=UPI00295F2BB8|nr:DUF4230 domain-containing protein [Rossellomorea marisflavi]
MIKIQYLKFLLRALILIAALFIAINAIRGNSNQEPIKIVKQHEEVKEDHYIITKELIVSKLTSRSQLVSMEQDFIKLYTDVDKGFLGDRYTELTVKGKYILGLETKDIEVKHVDEEQGIVYLKLGKPTLISLEIPYDQVEFDKTKGWLRLAANEDEEVKFYKSVVKDIKKRILSDEEVIKQAELHNKQVVEDLLEMTPGVKSVIFE